MEFSNQKRSKRIKRAFNLTGLLIALTGLAFFWFKMDIALMITIGIFMVYVGVSVYANLCYISFSTNNGKVQIKYYPVISFLKKEYDSIEFAHQSLLNFQIEKAMGFSDLTIAIRTKRGIAEYPTISLAALSKAEIEQIRQALEEIIRNNRRAV
jgi:hypothetical protein